MYTSVKNQATKTLPKSVLHGEHGVVTIKLQIQRNGKLLYLPEVLESSGSKTLDHHAVVAIRGAVPFDKLPASSPAPIELHLKFLYNMPPDAVAGAGRTDRCFTERSGEIAYSFGPKGLFKGCRVLSSRSI